MGLGQFKVPNKNPLVSTDEQTDKPIAIYPFNFIKVGAYLERVRVLVNHR